MAYSELIKSFDRIREYMRQFYVYGFRSRSEFTEKSERSYDNERRRIESWLGAYMGFRQTPEGKNVFLSVDSRSVPANPLYQAFKAKSFTPGDVIFHFYVLDLLSDGSAYTAGEILDLLWDNYLCMLDREWQPDLSTVRKKLKEYVSLGLLTTQKQGRELRYRRAEDSVALDRWADAVAFFSEADPLGVIGSSVLDRLEEKPDYFRFKHHYILHALDSRILLQLLCTIGEKKQAVITSRTPRSSGETAHRVYPMKIYCSTQNGRQYLLCWHFGFQKLVFFRLDYIQKVEPGQKEAAPEGYEARLAAFLPFCWGTSAGSGTVDHLEMTLTFTRQEKHIPQRLEREKRNGTVEMLDEHTCRYCADVYDAVELLPWLRTFTGRILELKCTNPEVEKRFYGDLEQMYRLYGGEI